MKSLIVICLFAVVAAVVARPGEQYTDRFDNVNLDEILSNRRLLIPYVKCALDQAKCTPDGKELKSHIRDALENGCAKCTKAQQEGTRRVIGHLINNEPEYWNQLTLKYDRDHKYTKKYETELRKVRH
ncbi:allergen Tha p 1 [Amyelois transitella]|uniref:allergen Tha p 1 n=1 Tax=Amyelois transitella TaxID=680683 RepID=UPI00299020FF|nr:allergen Tha p 1 [Amyelois transitella]